MSWDRPWKADRSKNSVQRWIGSSIHEVWAQALALQNNIVELFLPWSPNPCVTLIFSTHSLAKTSFCGYLQSCFILMNRKNLCFPLWSLKQPLVKRLSYIIPQLIRQINIPDLVTSRWITGDVSAFWLRLRESRRCARTCFVVVGCGFIIYYGSCSVYSGSFVHVVIL